MSDLLWCPECRHSRISEEHSWLFVQRCERCGTELEDDAPPLESISEKSISATMSKKKRTTEKPSGTKLRATKPTRSKRRSRANAALFLVSLELRHGFSV